MDLEGWSPRLKVFADATRVRLLALLEREELTVAELSAITRLAQPRVSTHLAKLKEAGLVRDRRAGVSAYYRFDEASARPRAARAVASPARRQRRPAAAPGRRARAGGAGHARGRPELGRLGGRRHGTPLLARPHLGSAGALGAAAAGARRRARHRLGRRRAGRTAGAACATATSASTPARAWWPPPASACAASATSKCAKATCTPCPSPTRSFDLVVLMHALTYAAKPAQAVAEAARVLRRGGRLLLSQPGAATNTAPRCEAYGHANLGFSRQGTAQVRREGRAGRRQPAGTVTRERRPPHFEVISLIGESNREHDPKHLPWLNPAARRSAAAALAERILIIDGAMGTMIQRHAWRKPTIAASASSTASTRTPRCHGATASCGARPEGQQRPAALTQAGSHRAAIHAAYLEAGADLVETNTFNATSISQADYRLRAPGLRAEQAKARALARAALRCRRSARRRTSRASSIGVLGPTSRTASISPDVNDPGFRNTSFDELRDDLPRSRRRPDRRRRRRDHGRNHLRHAQRQGGAVRDRGSVRGARRRACR